LQLLLFASASTAVMHTGADLIPFTVAAVRQPTAVSAVECGHNNNYNNNNNNTKFVKRRVAVASEALDSRCLLMHPRQHLGGNAVISLSHVRRPSATRTTADFIRASDR